MASACSPSRRRRSASAGDAAETVERLLPNRTTFEPDAGRHAHYQGLFEVYHDLSRGLLPTFDRLAGGAAR